MPGKHPTHDEEYQDWEYPTPEEISDLNTLPFTDEPSSSLGTRMPVLLKIVGTLSLLAFVGSLLVPVLGALVGHGNQTGSSTGKTTQESQVYQQWIWSSISAVLSESSGLGQVLYLGVEFGDSVQDVVVGIELERTDLRSNPKRGALQSTSIAILQRLFADERAESVTLAWLRPIDDTERGESHREVVLTVGMLRQTADKTDWANLRGEDLRYVADHYQEQPPASEELL